MVRRSIRVSFEELWKPDLPYGSWTYGVKVRPEELFFMGGMVPIDSKGELVGKGNMKAQIAQVVKNIGLALAAAGLTLRDVVNMRIYTTKINEVLKLTEWRCREFPELFGSKPGDQTAASSTLIEAKRLAGKDFLIEIEVIAAKEA